MAEHRILRDIRQLQQQGVQVVVRAPKSRNNPEVPHLSVGGISSAMGDEVLRQADIVVVARVVVKHRQDVGRKYTGQRFELHMLEGKHSVILSFNGRGRCQREEHAETEQGRKWREEAEALDPLRRRPR